MVDSVHLEKMGRELKCPICLSLVNSAVSLTCNHVFCNLCISKSMKSASNCPVCKVPYRRREIRPAPHMDNLVSIYKNMELASGVNIFLTQNVPLAKNSEDVQTMEADGSNSDRERANEYGETIKRRHLKRKGSKEMEKINIGLPDSHPSPKPSFPAKKRVRVPQYNLSETLTQHNNVLNLGNRIADLEVERRSSETATGSRTNNSVVLKEKPAFDDKGEPVFKPFFWLREGNDDDEISEDLSAQQIEGDQFTGSSPANVVTFSDIKDSDDENPIKMTPTGKGCIKSRVADAFDSEMFDWTQSACSPELPSTPKERQKECKTITGMETAFGNIVSECVKSQNIKEGNDENMHMEFALSSSKQGRNNSANNTKKGTIRRCKISKSKVESKGAEMSTARTEDPVDPTEAAESFSEGSRCNLYSENGKSATSERKRRKRNKKGKCKKISMDWIGRSAAEEESKQSFMKPTDANDQEQGKENVDMELPAFSCQQIENDKALGHKKKTFKPKMRKAVRQVKNKNVNTSVAEVLKEIPINNSEQNQAQRSREMDKEFPDLSSQQTENIKIQDSGRKTRNAAEKIQTEDERRSIIRESRKQKRLKKCTDDTARCKSTDGLDTNRSAENENKHPENSDIEENESSTKKKVLPTYKECKLQKCQKVLNEVRCAFCQSGNDSEASGEMMHYLDGKPVSADYNEGSNVIHSHRNCTEWAPNVYFEDDAVINLEMEIARSKRIKCGLCGIKGASLGCYEKSCRKSFHVPCAKLVSQCRWDTDNFVMLCALHASSKLPKEIHKQQCRSRVAQKVQSQALVVGHHGQKKNGNWKWPSTSPCKWVLCCSALTAEEKEIVSNFTRLVGVSLSSTWSSTITHIIASTNENGACKRTLKFLMGILEGKWIVKIDWIKACMAAMAPVGEEHFEICMDIHGINDGPRLGRLRLMNKDPKLFNGCTFYFMGEFSPSYKGDLQNLVIAGGGTVLQRKPISRDQERLLNESSASTTFIIYSLELPEKCNCSKKDLLLNHRRTKACSLANATGAKVAGHSWILDSIAACKLQKLN